jgi:hypothetical protein
VAGTKVSIVVMAADHGHDQRERQEPVEGRKQALILQPVRPEIRR